MRGRPGPRERNERTMRDQRINLFRARVFERMRCERQGRTRVAHVVDQDGDLCARSTLPHSLGLMRCTLSLTLPTRISILPVGVSGSSPFALPLLISAKSTSSLDARVVALCIT